MPFEAPIRMAKKLIKMGKATFTCKHAFSIRETLRANWSLTKDSVLQVRYGASTRTQCLKEDMVPQGGHVTYLSESNVALLVRNHFIKVMD